jgi:hypothetical protein
VNNFIVVIGIIVALAGAALFMMLSNQSEEGREAPGGNQNQKIIVENGKISPKQIDVSSQYPVIFIVHNFSAQQHELVFKKLDADGNEGKELRHFVLDANEHMNIRFKLEPGEYILYCTISKGEHSHRKDGEEAKIIVD